MLELAHINRKAQIELYNKIDSVQCGKIIKCDSSQSIFDANSMSCASRISMDTDRVAMQIERR